MDQRKNTIKVQLPGQNEKPSDSEMVKWVAVDLGLKGDEIVGLSQNPVNDGVMYIKCVSEQKMKEIIEKFDGTVFKFLNGTAVRVSLTEASENIRYVRIFGLPFEVDDEHIEGFLRSFGIVKRLVKEKYPAYYNFDVLSGVRGIYIDLKKEIPAYLYMRGVRVKVHYHGMKEKCHLCGSPDHMRNECPNRPTTGLSPYARLNQTEAMQNLNSLFKKPVTVTASQTFAATVTGETSPKKPNEDQPIIQLDEVAGYQSDETIVLNSGNSMSEIDFPIPLDVLEHKPDELRVHEGKWQQVLRNKKPRKGNASPAKTARVRTESESSAASTTSSRGRGRPKKQKNQMVIQHIADNGGQQFGVSPAIAVSDSVLPMDTAADE
jgi:hypothetical protein